MSVRGLPPSARDRLRELTGDGAPFTSGLSVNEFALLRRLGPRPVAQVMGASAVRVGWQYLPALPPGEVVISSVGGRAYGAGPGLTGVALQNRFGETSPSQVRNYLWHTEVVCELDVVTAAWRLARRQALDRLREEALAVGADAVVGVHLRRGEHDLGRRTIDCLVTGTAIRHQDRPPSTSPTLSDLSVQDYWRLACAGFEPVGLVADTVVVFASPALDARLRRRRTTTRSQELAELSGAFTLARGTVRTRLRDQVADARGRGVVGVELSHRIQREKIALASALQTADRRGWHIGRFGVPYRVSGRGEAERRGWMITMHAAGTAIAPGGPPVAGTARSKAILRLGAT
ncbi:MAG: heavy metal-binding domain-containing protein [Solirubrobacteraceae bacterium]